MRSVLTAHAAHQTCYRTELSYLESPKTPPQPEVSQKLLILITRCFSLSLINYFADYSMRVVSRHLLGGGRHLWLRFCLLKEVRGSDHRQALGLGHLLESVADSWVHLC